MAGLYIHIPFCRKACHYCNFHFSTTLHQKNDLVDALLAEIAIALANPTSAFSTVYFGGGTPSLLPPQDLQRLMDAVKTHGSITPDLECTLEANPDDINPDQLQAWKSIGINRLSLGIQSFRDEDLRWMNRAHNGQQARNALEMIRAAGFHNISADLIYGTPGLDNHSWQEQVETLLAFEVPHISAYALTVEPRTALDQMIRLGKKADVEPDQQAAQFLILADLLEKAGFEHYEISNFALPGMRSRHNSSYWQGIPYIGIGPSAHSYDGQSRRWNVSHNAEYIRAIQEGRIPYTEETLDSTQRLNEYMMTALRTMEGIDLKRLKQEWGEEVLAQVMAVASKYEELQYLALDEDRIRLSREGKLFADGIAAAMFR